MSGLGAAPGLGEGYAASATKGAAGIDANHELVYDLELHEYVKAPTRRWWSWQRPGGAVNAEDMAEPETETLTEVTRAQLVEWLSEWMEATGSSQLGGTFNVTRDDGREKLAAYLLDGLGSAGGSVRAVVERLGFHIVE